MAITPDNLLALVETDRTPEALQRLIDAAYAEIAATAGTLLPQTVTVGNVSRTPELYLTRPAASLVAVQAGQTPGFLSVLDPAAYTLSHQGMVVRRTDGRVWDRHVVVTYLPVQDVALRDAVVVDLVKLALQYEGLRGQSVGDYSLSHVDYVAEQRRLLSRLMTQRRWVA